MSDWEYRVTFEHASNGYDELSRIFTRMHTEFGWEVVNAYRQPDNPHFVWDVVYRRQVQP